MPDDSREKRKSPAAWWLVAILGVAAIVLGWQLDQASKMAGHSAVRLVNERRVAESEKLVQANTIGDLKKAARDREAEFAARFEELRQREAAIAGRENAATERTQSSFQGLMIQQQLTKNLEALKASLPDLTPEVEKLAREHAQLGAERQRLEKENADLRRQLGPPARP